MLLQDVTVTGWRRTGVALKLSRGQVTAAQLKYLHIDNQKIVSILKEQEITSIQCVLVIPVKLLLRGCSDLKTGLGAPAMKFHPDLNCIVCKLIFNWEHY